MLKRRAGTAVNKRLCYKLIKNNNNLMVQLNTDFEHVVHKVNTLMIMTYVEVKLWEFEPLPVSRKRYGQHFLLVEHISYRMRFNILTL